MHGLAMGWMACLLFPSLWAQTPELARVQSAHASLRAAGNETDRLALHTQLETLWIEALEAGSILEVNWSEWNEALVDLGESNNRLLVFTWNVEMDNRTQRYGGWVVRANPEKELGYDWVSLKHEDQGRDAEDNRMFRHDGWHGCLYYDGVVTYDRNRPVYTLLAWDGHNSLTNRKWVESVTMNGGRAKFGLPNILMPEGLRKRCVLTYGDAVQATVRIEPQMNRIVMDHLAPQSPEFSGQKPFYGPTLSYDALVWRKDAWQWEANVAVSNPSEGDRREYRDPSARRTRRRN